MLNTKMILTALCEGGKTGLGSMLNGRLGGGKLIIIP